jgi:tetratricopeptide (TPR) repeat protein
MQLPSLQRRRFSQAEIKTHTYTVRQLFGGSQSQDDIQVVAIHKDDYQTIPLNSNLADAYYNRGLAYLALRQFENACSDFQEACK